MDENAETWHDKRRWGPGPWQDEPDRIEWRDDATGLSCLMLRHENFGSWCAYVGVPPGHPRYEVDWGELPDEVWQAAHHGVNFSHHCMEDDRPLRERVCHVPLDGEDDALWWFGFDCAHMMDLMPALRRWESDEFGLRASDLSTYRTARYVRERVTAIAAALGAP
jgi:hypothetical protein